MLHLKGFFLAYNFDIILDHHRRLILFRKNVQKYEKKRKRKRAVFCCMVTREL